MIDVFVIGAGPAGLSAAINAKISGRSVKVIGFPGNYLAKAHRVDNYLGFYGVNGQDMMNAFVDHATKLGVEIVNSTVLKILPIDDKFMINAGLDVFEAKTVILALGVLNEKQIQGEKELLGRGVSYCATCDGMLYRGKRAIVYGLTQSAAREANQLKNIGVDVSFVWNNSIGKGRLEDDIECIKGNITKVQADNTELKVDISGKQYHTDALFVLRSTIAPDSLLDGLESEKGYIKVDRNMTTNIKGVYAAGDCTGKPLQISKAVGEGLIAAQMASAYISSLNR